MGISVGARVCSVDRHVDAPADVVWGLLIDLRHWPRWGPSVRRAELDGGGHLLTPGAQGTVWTVAGVRLRFTITDFEAGRRWNWRVAGVPATGHQVVPAAGGCRVTFEVPWWAAPYLTVCRAALAHIAELATAAGDMGQSQ